MESLGRIGETLPPDELAEKELQAAFRGAALSLTGLFKIGKKASKKGKHLVQSLLALWESWATWSLPHDPVIA